MKKLLQLISACSNSVSLSVNENRDYYKSVKDWIEESEGLDKDEIDVENEIVQKMIETDTCVDLIFYPTSPKGFYRIWHYDVELALDKALKIINKEA